jgi:hypothetical protein
MRALPLSVFDSVIVQFSGTLVPLMAWNTRAPVNNFIKTRLGHRPSLITRVVFPEGREFIMSMQHHKPGQAVIADSWMLFCPECSQKMRIIMAAPTQDGRETRTYECVYGHRERVTVTLH